MSIDDSECENINCYDHLDVIDIIWSVEANKNRLKTIQLPS